MVKRLLIVLILLGVVVGAWYWRHRRDAEIDAALPGLLAALQAETREFEQFTWERPPVFGDPVEGFARDHYREAARIYTEVEESLWGSDIDLEFMEAANRYLAWECSPLTVPAGMKAQLHRFTPAIDALIAGARCTAAGPHLAGDEERADLPYHLREFVGHGLACAVWRLEKQEEDRAVDVLLALLRLGEDIARGSWSDQTDSAMVRRDVMKLVCAAVANGATSEAGVRRLEQALVTAPLEPRISRRMLEAGWLDEQWNYARAARGEEGLLEGMEEMIGPIEKILPTGRHNVIAGWRYLRKFEEEVAATMPVATTGDLRMIAAKLQAAADSDGFRLGFYAGSHRFKYMIAANTWDYLAALRSVLAANIALYRSRAAGAADPADLSGVIAANLLLSPLVDPATWWSHPEVERPWIGIGAQHREMPPWAKRMVEEALEED